MNKNNVGLVSVSIHNYGSLLQTYAMQKTLDNLEIENDIILFKSDPIKQLYRIFNFPFIKMKLKLYNRKLVTKLFHNDIFKGAAQRDAEFMAFKRNYCRFTPKTTSRERLLEMGKEYDAFVLGSDQVWNPANLEMDFYTLNFVPEEKTKVAYAPSFGVSKIPDKQIEKTKAYLNRIQYISVREIAGTDIINNLTGRKVPVVCDPTALLTKEQWDELKSNKEYVNGKYIFCYFLGSNPMHREFANRVKEVTGYTIVALQHIDEFVKSDLTFGDITPYNVGPQDFVNLLSNAEIVLTDSFHGTMFSIYYSKNFYTFPRFSEGKKESTNSRISSILNLMNLNNRKVSGDEDVEQCLKRTVDWENVQNKLSSFRKESFDWLIEALCKGGVISEDIRS